MKTPRDILLEKHRDAETQLDEIRAGVVQQLGVREGSSFAQGVAHAIWIYLIRPFRLYWAGLAALWVLIAAMNLATGPADNSGSKTAHRAAGDLGAQIRAYQATITRLAKETEPAKSESEVPKPRSEIIRDGNPLA